MSKNNRVFVIFFSILLFLTVGMSEKAYAEQISGTVHNELVGTFDKSQTSNRTIEEVDRPLNSANVSWVMFDCFRLSLINLPISKFSVI